MWGRAARTTSPSVRSSMRSTPWVDGCCGPMFRIISSLSRSSSLQPMPPPASGVPVVPLAARSLVIHVPVGGREVEGADADLLAGQEALRHLLRRPDVHAVVELGVHPVLAQRVPFPV